MKKIFIDCGGNRGQSIINFVNSELYSKDYLMYSFEPIPWLNKFYKNRKDVIFSSYAVWINNNRIPFYISKRLAGIGSSLKKEKFSCDLDKKIQFMLGD